MMVDRLASRVLRIVAIAGGIVGLGAIASTVLGQSAPSFLQPIVPSAGIHSYNASNIYLSPSIFATAEEASEVLLIALFAWIALEYLRYGKLKRIHSTLVGILILGGLFAAERRADIYVAVSGIIILVILNRALSSRSDKQVVSRHRTTGRSRFGLALMLVVFGSGVVITFLGASTLLPFLASGSPGGRISLMFSTTNPTSFTGQGTGTSTQGVGVIGASSFFTTNNNGSYTGYIFNGRTFITGEGGLTKTWLELGLVGVGLYAGVFLSVLSPPARSIRRLDNTGRALLVLTVALGVIFLKGHQSLDDPLVQPLYWLAAGGIWGRMRSLAHKQHMETAQATIPVIASPVEATTRHADVG